MPPYTYAYGTDVALDAEERKVIRTLVGTGRADFFITSEDIKSGLTKMAWPRKVNAELNETWLMWMVATAPPIDRSRRMRAIPVEAGFPAIILRREVDMADVRTETSWSSEGDTLSSMLFARRLEAMGLPAGSRIVQRKEDDRWALKLILPTGEVLAEVESLASDAYSMRSRLAAEYNMRQTLLAQASGRAIPYTMTTQPPMLRFDRTRRIREVAVDDTPPPVVLRQIRQ